MNLIFKPKKLADFYAASMHTLAPDTEPCSVTQALKVHQWREGLASLRLSSTMARANLFHQIPLKRWLVAIGCSALSEILMDTKQASIEKFQPKSRD